MNEQPWVSEERTQEIMSRWAMRGPDTCARLLAFEQAAAIAKWLRDGEAYADYGESGQFIALNDWTADEIERRAVKP